jgi:hypothetical protein
MAKSIPGFYTEEEQARRLSVTPRTLRRWRGERYGPNPTVVGRFVYYAEKAEADFLASCQVSLQEQRRGRRRGVTA